jgi:hypothetical protein
VCHVERIDHGYTAASDPDLVRRLAQENIALTMCPLSNLRLQVVDDLTAYPLSLLLDAGVQVTLNSDDPPYFGGYINANYEAVGRSLELTQATLAQIARNGFLGSFASPEDIAAEWMQSTHTSNISTARNNALFNDFPARHNRLPCACCGIDESRRRRDGHPARDRPTSIVMRRQAVDAVRWGADDQNLLDRLTNPRRAWSRTTHTSQPSGSARTRPTCSTQTDPKDLIV